jgi:4-hydroxy-tetrahydrodipicolinate synthase
MSKKTIFKGAATALVTPMLPDGNVDYERFAQVIEEQIAGNIDALLICGTTGECPTLTDDEHIECIRFAVEKINKRVPVIAGTGSNDTLYSLELSLAAKKAGADALLLVSPYYNKTSQRGLVKHFEKIADSVRLPIMLYNIPARTNVNIEISTLVELSKHPNIVAVKECTGKIEYTGRIKNACGDNLDIYCGEDALTVAAMAYGAKGVVSVASNIIPKEIHTICEYAENNDYRAASALMLKYLNLIDALFIDVNPMPIKAAFRLMNKGVGGCRLPLCEISEETESVLKQAMQEVGLI